MNATEAIAKTLNALGRAEAVAEVVQPEAAQVAEFIGGLAKKKNMDLTDFLDSDPEVQRALLQAADVEAAIHSGIDWASLSADVLKQAYSIVKATAAVAAIAAL